MAQDKHAFVKVRGGSLKLNGPKCFIKQIKDNITAYLDNIEKDAEMNADKGASKCIFSFLESTFNLTRYSRKHEM